MDKPRCQLPDTRAVKEIKKRFVIGGRFRFFTPHSALKVIYSYFLSRRETDLSIMQRKFGSIPCLIILLNSIVYCNIIVIILLLLLLLLHFLKNCLGLFPAKWPTNALTYDVTSYPTAPFNLQNKEMIDEMIATSFKVCLELWDSKIIHDEITGHSLEFNGAYN